MHNFPIDLISAEVDNKPVIVTKKKNVSTIRFWVGHSFHYLLKINAMDFFIIYPGHLALCMNTSAFTILASSSTPDKLWRSERLLTKF